MSPPGVRVIRKHKSSIMKHGKVVSKSKSSRLKKTLRPNVNKQQRPNNINLITTATTALNSPINSPARYCDSPHSSISIKSTSEKADSGYQSSVQNNSDSESCI